MGRTPTFTVADVVRMAQVTERTVRRDIASGTLPSVKLPNGQRRFRRADIEKYRCSRILQKPHMKMEELAQLCGMSLRTLRRHLRRKDFPIPIVRASARRHFVSHSVFTKWAGGKDVVATLERAARDGERGDRLTRYEPPASGQGRNERSLPSFFLIREVAKLAGKTVRQVYHDVDKGALDVWQLSRRGRILVPIGAAEAYCGRRLSVIP